MKGKRHPKWHEKKISLQQQTEKKITRLKAKNSRLALACYTKDKIPSAVLLRSHQFNLITHLHE